MTAVSSDRSNPQWVHHWATTTPEAVAVVENGTSFTYREFAYNTVQYVQLLESMGVAKGMLVGIQCNYNYLGMILQLACEVIQATSVFLTPSMLTTDQGIVDRCNLLCIENMAKRFALRQGVLPLTQDNLNRVAAMPLSEVSCLNVQSSGDFVVRILTTSGTTSKTKYIPVTARQRTRRARVHTTTFRISETIKTVFLPFSIYSTVGYQVPNSVLRLGGTIHWLNLDTDFTSIAKDKGAGTCIRCSPIQATRLLSVFKDPEAKKFDQLVFAGGSPSPALVTDLLKYCTHSVSMTYGSTECGPIASGLPGQMGAISNGVQVRIVGQSGDIQPENTVGFIEVRSDAASTQYLWDSELTRKTFVNGWCRTFDLGYIPEPGKLVVLGRGDDILNIGGVKIAPQPIEEKIRALRGVSDAVLLALPSPAGVEGLHVVIERADKGLDTALVGQIEPLVPHQGFQCHFLEKMPRTETGKIQRNALRDILMRHLHFVSTKLN